MGFIASKHHIGILRTDGSTTCGLILATDKDGVPIYQIYDDEYIPEPQGETAGYDSLPPEKEVQVEQSDWRSGFGLETYDSADPKRYQSSTNFDLRFRGMGILSQKATAATLPTLMTITDGGLEIWTDANTLTNWTYEESDAGNALTQESTIIDEETYSAKIDVIAGNTKYGRIYQDAVTWSNDFRGTTFIVTARVHPVDANSTATLRIDDGKGTTDANSAGTGAFETLTATRKLAADATRLRIYCITTNNTGSAVVNYWDNVVLRGTYGNHGIAWVEFDGDLFFSSNDCLLRVNNSTGAITLQATMTAAITDLEVFSDTQLYITLGTSTSYYEMTTAEAFTECTLANSDMKYMKMVQLTADTMYGADGLNTIRSTTNPADGGTAWSAQTILGSTDDAITGLIPFRNALYIMKEDKPWYLDSSSYTKVLTNMTEGMVSTTGGKNALVWNERLYMPYGTDALLEYDPVNDVLTWLNPSNWCTESAAFDGRIMALASDEMWLFAAIDNGASLVEILAGRYETIDNVTQWVWHPISQITLTGVEKMFTSSVFQERIWISSTDSTEDLYYIPLPEGYGNITADTNRSFQTGGYFVTPWHHANFKGDDKAWIKITLTMSGTSSTVYFTVEYQLIGSTNWTEINPTVKFKTSPKTSGYIPVDDTSSANPVSTMIRFRITGVTGATTSTPILFGYDVRGILYPSKRSLIACVVKCSDETTTIDGTRERDNDAANITTVLNEAKNATYPVTIYDIDGNTKTVRFLPTKPFSKVTKYEKGRAIERYYYLLLQEVTTS